MNIAITFRHMTGSDAVKRHVEAKFAKLQKFMRQPMAAHVTLSVDGLQHEVDVRVSAGSTHFQAAERSEDMYASIDLVLDKLERQITSEKSSHNKKGSASARELAENPEMVVAPTSDPGRSRSRQ